MPKDTMDEFGAPGARGESGKSSGGPHIDKDTLSSKHILRVVEAICEGPVKSISPPYFNKTPFMGPDDKPNFKGLTYQIRLGLPAQTALPNFTGQEAETLVDAIVEKATPVVRTITDADTDDVKVQIKIPALFNLDKDDGDMRVTDLSYRIEYRPSGQSTWIAAKGSPFTLNDQKSTSAIFLTHRFTLTGAAPWDIRLVRVTDDSPDPTDLANDLYFYSFTQIINQKFTYPNTALCGFVAQADQFGSSMPARGYLVEGLLCRVPSNFNTETRTYTGVWNGTFKYEWTDCPAWCVRELIRNPRWGLGRYFNANFIDDTTLYAISAYCAERVPDGKGGTEPRFTFNAYINSRFDAYQLLNSMVSVFRGMVHYAFGAIHFTADRPRDPELNVTRANTVNGEFVYKGASLLQQHNRVNVTYNNPKNGYEREVVSVDEPDDIIKYGLRPTDIVAFACTSESQAIRAGRWLLYTERMESETVTYIGGEDHIDIGPGSVIRIMDPVQMGYSMGGRLRGYIGSTVTLDRPVTLLAGVNYELVVHDKERVLHYRTITNAPGQNITQITTNAPMPDLTANPKETVWAIKRFNPAMDTQWRVLGSAEVGRHQYEITAVRHMPNKFDIIEQGLEIPDFPPPLLPTGALPTPLNLRARESTQPRDGAENDVTVTVSMTKPVDPRVRGLRVRYCIEGNDWVVRDLGQGTTTDITGLMSGVRMKFQAQSYDGVGGVSLWSPTFILDLSGNPTDSLIPNISNVLITPGFRSFTLRWTNPDLPNLRAVEIWGGATNSIANATMLTSTTSERHQIGGLNNGQRMHFWARVLVRGARLRYSDMAYLGTGVTTRVGSDDIGPGVIGPGALDQSLIDLINEASGSAAGDVAAAQAARDAAVAARQVAEAARDTVLGALDDAQEARDAAQAARDRALTSEDAVKAVATGLPLLPFNFEAGKTLWTNDAGQPPATAPDTLGEIVTDPGMGKSLQFNFLGSSRTDAVYPKGVIPTTPGRIYRVTLQFKVMSVSDGSGTFPLQVGLVWVSGTYGWVAWPAFGSEEYAVGDTVVTKTYVISNVSGTGIDYSNSNLGSTPFMRVGLRGASSTKTGVVRIGQIKIEDITDVFAADVSARAASGYADFAEARADEAGEFAQAANGSATTASTAAGNAQTYSTQASTSAQNAEGSANAAALAAGASATSRREAVYLVGNPSFGQGVIGWGRHENQTEAANPVPATSLFTGGPTANALLRFTSTSRLSWKGIIPVKQGNAYRVMARIRRTSTGQARAHIGVSCYDANGAFLGNIWAAVNGVSPPTQDEWIVYSAVIREWGSGNGRFNPGTVFAAPMAIFNNGDATGTTEVDELSLIDVTGEVLASSYADAAFRSEGVASTKADEAGVSASAASVSATNAASSFDGSVKSVADTLPDNFAKDGLYWSRTLAGPPKDRAPLTAAFDFVDDDIGRVARVSTPLTENAIISHLSYVPVKVGRTYRFTVVLKHVGTFSGGSANAASLNLRGLTSAYVATNPATVGTVQLPLATANVWTTFTYDYVGVAGVPFIAPYLQFLAANMGAAGRGIRIGFFRVEDVTSQVAAAKSADDAYTYQGNASTYAGNASTSASNAAGSESRAAEYSGLSASAQKAARDTVAKNFPPDFQQDSLFWTNSVTGAPGALPDLPAEFTFLNVAGAGRVAQLVGPLAANRNIAPKAYIPMVPGRKYRATVRARHVGAISGGSPTAIRVIWRSLDESYASPTTEQTNQLTFTAADTFQTFTAMFTVPTGFTKPYILPYLEFASSRFTAARTIQVVSFLIEDVTAQEAAAQSAASAVESAGFAAADAGRAGNSASAALADRVRAETARSGAETAEINAAASEANARGYSSQAYRSQTAAARLSSGGANPNPVFELWSNANLAPDGPIGLQLPTGDSDYTYFAKQSNNPNTPDIRPAKYNNALMIRSSANQTSDGPFLTLLSNSALTDSPNNPEWVYVKAEIEWISGALSGAMLQVSWIGTNVVSQSLVIEPLSFYAGMGKPCTLDQLFQRPSGFVPGSDPYVRVRFVTQSGTPRRATTFRIHRFDFEAVHAQAQAAIFQRAKTSLEGIQSATIGMRVSAGSQNAVLELVALENPQGPAFTGARISADTILLDGSVTARKLAIGDGANLIGDSPFRQGTWGWAGGGNGIVQQQTSDWAIRPGNQSYSAVGKETFFTRQTGVAQDGFTQFWWRGRGVDNTMGRGCRVNANKWYEFSVAIACVNALRSFMFVSWYDVNFEPISTQEVPGTSTAGTNAVGNMNNPDAWPRTGAVMTPPAGAAYALVGVRHTGTAPGQTESFTFFYQPMVRESKQGAELSSFAEGGQTTIGTDGIATDSLTARHMVKTANLITSAAQIGDATVRAIHIGPNALYVPYLFAAADVNVPTNRNVNNQIALLDRLIPDFEGGGYVVALNAMYDSTQSKDAFGMVRLVLDGVEVARTRIGTRANGGSDAVAMIPVTLLGTASGYGSTRVQVFVYNSNWGNPDNSSNPFTIRNIKVTVSGTRR